MSTCIQKHSPTMDSAQLHKKPVPASPSHFPLKMSLISLKSKRDEAMVSAICSKVPSVQDNSSNLVPYLFLYSKACRFSPKGPDGRTPPNDNYLCSSLSYSSSSIPIDSFLHHVNTSCFHSSPFLLSLVPSQASSTTSSLPPQDKVTDGLSPWQL